MSDAITLPSADHLAQRFSWHLRDLLRGLGKDVERTMQEINRRNRPEDPQVCHSHDFCDANVAMLAAMEEFGMEMKAEDEEQMRLINKAWRIAKRAGFPEGDDG